MIAEEDYTATLQTDSKNAWHLSAQKVSMPLEEEICNHIIQERSPELSASPF